METTITLDTEISNLARIRSGPSTDHDTIGSKENGEVITVDGRNAGGDWVRLLLDEGEYGWVAGDLVDLSYAQIMTLTEAE